MDWLTFVVVDPVKAMLMKLWGYVPAVAGALVILIAGWLIAKVIGAVVSRILKALKLDELSNKAGISKVLAQGEIKAGLSDIVAGIIYWVIILVVVATALSALNLTIAANLVSKLVSYVPCILGAIFILVLGSFLANLVATIVRTSASNLGGEKAKLLGKIAQIILLIFTVVAAIEQLKIATALIILAVNIILISIGIAIALAFGLGCKDLAGKAAADFINSLKK